MADAAALPFEDQSFDLLFHRMMAEHLDKPAAALAETARSLQPGGRLLPETPSRSHYPMLIVEFDPDPVPPVSREALDSGPADEEEAYSRRFTD